MTLASVAVLLNFALPKNSRSPGRSWLACRRWLRGISPACWAAVRPRTVREPVGRVVGGAAPHVRIADPRDRDRQRLALAGGHRRKLEADQRVARVGDVPAAECGDLRQRPSGLGTRDPVAWEQLELVGPGRVVVAQAEEPGDDFGAEVRRGRKPGPGGRGLHVRRNVAEAELLHEHLVEGHH
jgi:hypothetical protein